MTGRAFVTGGTGLLGKAVVARLVRDGRPVTALVRSESAAGTARRLGAVPVHGDVLQLEDLRPAMSACEVVYHLAGINAFCLRDPRMMFRVNVGGSQNVVLAGARAGVRRVVYTSSAATLGELPGSVGSEDSPHRGSFLSSYEQSKYQAELAVSRIAEQEGQDVVIVNPSSVQGPGRTGGTARLLLSFVNGRLRVAVNSRMSLIDIADCAEGHVLAEERGSRGERYVLSGATLTVAEGLEILRDITGIKETPRMLPPFLALGGGAAVELVARIRGRPAPVCREMVRTLLHGHAYDGSKAAQELGLAYTPLRETLRRTVEWYVDQGLVTRPLPGFETSPP